ncbi:MAG: regulatory protein RecX [Nitrospinae bacterium]|nr:regulatory protein RecX [Nitrospinota bacterium]
MPRQKSPLEQAKDAALRFLSPRARTCREVEKKLRDKGFGEETILEALAVLGNLKYLDDRAFAADWVECRSGNRFIGPLRLRKELEAKGVDEEIRNEAVDEYFRRSDEKGLALKAAERRLKIYKDVSGEKLKRRLFGYLQRKGFSTESALSALRKVLGE